ncbi:MAG TPA: hypothetical protein VGS05_06355 [Candidatus Sulfotelmatobacter sp.]|nr:hypothetical protein [Candidatus Sulfotelmatobacter sp.]
MQGKQNFGKNIEHGLGSWAPRLFDFLQSRDRKLVESSVLSLVLFVIYFSYLRSILDAPSNSGPLILTGAVVLKFLLFTGWPFAALSFYDRDWSSRDAGRVALLAFGLSIGLCLHSHGLHFCAFAAASLFFPLLVTAAVSHGIASLRHSL